jgi:hypothetical protein
MSCKLPTLNLSYKQKPQLIIPSPTFIDNISKISNDCFTINEKPKREILIQGESKLPKLPKIKIY